MLVKKPIHFILFTITFALAYLHSSAQCNCPPESDCKPCTGGYTSVTLRYDGPASSVVLIKDNDNVLANLTVSSSEEFTITGSKKNEKFADKKVPVLVNGLTNILLGSSCSDLTIGGKYGNFTIISAVTLGGNIVCCTPEARDNSAPLINNVPTSINVTVANGCSSQVTWNEPIASDNCGVKSFSSSHRSGDSFTLGSTNVVYTAIDDAGLSTLASFPVVVTDTKAPVFSGGPTTNIIAAADESCSAIVSWIEPQVSDDCSVIVTNTHKPNDRFEVGTTPVEYKAIDPSGNVSILNFNIIVEDLEKPVFNTFPENIVATLTSECSLRVSWMLPEVSDRCSSTTLISSHKSGDEFFLGTTTVKYVCKDESGNEAIKEFLIIVKDERALEILNCPSDILVQSEEEVPTWVTWTEPFASATCEEISLESTHKPQSVFPIGSTEVHYTARTPTGKTATCSFKVVIAYIEKRLDVSKLITPDGDGHNDEWIVSNIEEFRSNKVTIVDRYGGVIFEASGYDNNRVVWRGSNKSGGSVPTGTYFYLVVATDGKKQIKESGSLELVR